MVAFVEFVEQLGNGIKVESMPFPKQPIRWVASTELVEPEEFLEGGELVLTTGLFAKGWNAQQWDDYVGRLANSGCAGLGFGEGLSFPKVPEALADACSRRKVNLVSVARQLPFVQISQFIAELVSGGGGQSLADNSGLMIQQQLNRAAIKGDAVSLLQALASILRTQVAWHSESGNLLYGPYGDGTSTYPEDEFKQMIFAHQGLSSLEVEGRRVLPVGRSGLGEGYLCVDVVESATTWQLAALSLTVSLMGVIANTHFQRRMVLLQVEASIARLLVEGESSAAVLLAGQLGFEIGSPLRVAKCRIDSDNGVLRQLQSLDGVLFGASFWFVDDDGQGRRTLVLVSDHVYENLEKIVVNRPWGVGSEADLSTVAVSAEQAQWALTRAIRLGMTQEWSEKKAPQLWELISIEDGEAFVAQQLGPIVDDSQALETLRAYLLNGGSVAATAHELLIHRNSVIYRLQRLQKLLEMDLSDPSSRANLWAALQILRPKAGENLCHPNRDEI